MRVSTDHINVAFLYLYSMKSFAQIIIPTQNLTEEMEFFTELGFRLDRIYPDDDPQMAEMSGLGMHIRLDRNVKGTPPVLQVKTDEELADKTSPGGCKIEFVSLTYKVTYPPSVHAFEVRKLQDEEPWVIGRAGMHYRDLLPGRLGGTIMASHIRIPEGGPVPDMVHFHTIGFQLIFCYKGWVKLVYEDQGEPFILKAGDCVNQPPEIRHRVLEASDQLEVIEIGVPAAHMTSIDHELELPTSEYRPDREFQGQKFCRYQKDKATWKPWIAEGILCSNTGMAQATKGVASVQILKSNGNVTETNTVTHSSDIFFNFMMEGHMEIEINGQHTRVTTGEAFVIPPDKPFRFLNYSEDIEVLSVGVG